MDRVYQLREEIIVSLSDVKLVPRVEQDAFVRICYAHQTDLHYFYLYPPLSDSLRFFVLWLQTLFHTSRIRTPTIYFYPLLKFLFSFYFFSALLYLEPCFFFFFLKNPPPPKPPPLPPPPPLPI